MTDTIFIVGANPMECHTNLFLNHMAPGIRGGARVVIFYPRRTVTVDSCEQMAGAENVPHLAITAGSGVGLHDTLFMYITDQGWLDADFFAAATFLGDVAVPPPALHIRLRLGPTRLRMPPAR